MTVSLHSGAIGGIMDYKPEVYLMKHDVESKTKSYDEERIPSKKENKAFHNLKSKIFISQVPNT